MAQFGDVLAGDVLAFEEVGVIVAWRMNWPTKQNATSVFSAMTAKKMELGR